MSTSNAPLSSVDTVWLHMEHPTNLMMVTGVMMCAAHVSHERLKRTFEHRLQPFERFRQRVVEGVLAGPHWESDPTFDIASHIHRIALAKPGSKKSLLATIDDLASTPLDYSKPLWQVHLIDSYRGRSVVVMRFHHCIADGTAMVAVIARLMDTRARAPLDLPPPAGAPRAGERAARSLLAMLRSQYDLASKLAGTVVHEAVAGLLHPAHAAALAERAWKGVETIGHALLMPTDPPTPLKGALGVQKHVAWSEPVSLARVKQIGKHVDAKVNDVLLAAVSGALRSYLLRRDRSSVAASLRAIVPVDLRPPERALELGNEFGLVFVPLPIDVAEPRARLMELKRHMDEIKHSPEPYVYFGLLSAFGRAPKQIEERIVRLFGSKASAVMTNVIGPKQKLYLAGTAIDKLMFWVPQSGRLGVGISILSYAGKVTLGVIADAGLVPDPDAIARRFGRELELLRRSCMTSTRKARPATRRAKPRLRRA